MLWIKLKWKTVIFCNYYSQGLDLKDIHPMSGINLKYDELNIKNWKK